MTRIPSNNQQSFSKHKLAVDSIITTGIGAFMGVCFRPSLTTSGLVLHRWHAISVTRTKLLTMTDKRQMQKMPCRWSSLNGVNASLFRVAIGTFKVERLKLTGSNSISFPKGFFRPDPGLFSFIESDVNVTQTQEFITNAIKNMKSEKFCEKDD